MSTYKRAKVEIIPDHNRRDCVGLIRCKKEWKSFITPEEDFNNIGDLSFGKNTSDGVFQFWQPMSLYVVTKEQIVEGDWCMMYDVNDVPQRPVKCLALLFSTIKTSESHKYVDLYQPIGLYKKIIASSDPTMGLTEPKLLDGDCWWTGRHRIADFVALSSAREYWKSFKLPTPSPSFVQKYIKKHNEGQTITSILVEYVGVGLMLSGGKPVSITEVPNLSLAGNLTIAKVKEQWNRDEVIKLCQDAMVIGVRSQRENFSFNEKFLDFLDENNI
jgi:hypothetical protein